MVRALAPRHGGPGSILARCHMWIDFVVCSRLVPRPFSSKSTIPTSKADVAKYLALKGRKKRQNWFKPVPNACSSPLYRTAGVLIYSSGL